MEDVSRFDQSIQDLIGVKGGRNETFYEILGIEGEGMTEHYPSIGPDGEEIQFELGKTEEYMKHKTKRQRYTVRLVVAGNAVSAEGWLKRQGWKAFAIGATQVDLYVDPDLVDNPDLSDQK